MIMKLRQQESDFLYWLFFLLNTKKVVLMLLKLPPYPPGTFIHCAELLVLKGCVCQRSWYLQSHSKLVRYWRTGMVSDPKRKHLRKSNGTLCILAFYRLVFKNLSPAFFRPISVQCWFKKSSTLKIQMHREWNLCIMSLPSVTRCRDSWRNTLPSPDINYKGKRC